MRSFVLYWLLVATLLPTVSPLGIIAHYQLNREHIARVLCENRDRPELHCDGKCFLAKRLKAQQDKQDKETTEQVQNIASVQLFCETAIVFSFAPVLDYVVSTLFSAYLLKFFPSPLSALFRPPRTV